jgi:hypothetical protein
MLKGKMIIEMTDVHTGEKETVLENNMVTNALTEIFRPLGLLKSSNKLLSSITPYYNNLLGGILLFDTPIEENVNNVYAPQTANLVACGTYDTQNNTTITLRGGYNKTESEVNINDRYVKFVYDFTTSQGNGTIACVCLTHKNAGYCGYGAKDAAAQDSSHTLAMVVDDNVMNYVNEIYTNNSTSDHYSGYTFSKTECLFLIDREDDIAYYLRFDTVNKLSIIKRRAWLKNVSILDNPRTIKPLVGEVAIELTTSLLSQSYNSYYFDIADNCLYVISTANSSTSANAKIQVTKIILKTWTVTQYDMSNTTNVTLYSAGSRYAIVHQGYLFMRGDDSPYDLYSIELGNAANVSKYKNVGFTNYGEFPRICFAINGRIYYESYKSRYYLYIANMATNEILMSEANSIMCVYSSYARYPSYTPFLNEPMLWYASFGDWSSSNGGIFIMLNYLATINNLTEPVTKTADKTMKITYIIQEQ